MPYRRVFLGVLRQSSTELATAKSLPMYACYPALRPRHSPSHERRSVRRLLKACVAISGVGGGI